MANNDLFKNLFGELGSTSDLFSSSKKPTLDSELDASAKQFQSLFKASNAAAQNVNAGMSAAAEADKLLQESRATNASLYKGIDAANQEFLKSQQEQAQALQQQNEQNARAYASYLEEKRKAEEKRKKEEAKKRKDLIDALLKNPDLLPDVDFDSFFESPAYLSMSTDQRLDEVPKVVGEYVAQLEAQIAATLGFPNGQIPDVENWTLDQIAEDPKAYEQLLKLKDLTRTASDDLEAEMMHRLNADVKEIRKDKSFVKDFITAAKVAWEQQDLNPLAQNIETSVKLGRAVQNGEVVSGSKLAKAAPELASLVSQISDGKGNVDISALDEFTRGNIEEALNVNRGRTVLRANKEKDDIQKAEDGYSARLKDHQANFAYAKQKDPNYENLSMWEEAKFGFEHGFKKDMYSTILPSVPSIAVSVGAGVAGGAAGGTLAGGPIGTVVGGALGGAAGGAQLTATDVVNSTIEMVDSVPVEILAQRVPNWNEYLTLANGNPQRAKELLMYSTAGEQREWGYLIGGGLGMVDPGTILGAVASKPLTKMLGATAVGVAGKAAARQASGITAKSLAKSALKFGGSTIGGGIQESFEEGLTAYASSSAGHRIGIVDDPLKGVGEAAGMAFGIGGVFGGSAYGLGATGSAISSFAVNRDGVIRVTPEEAAAIYGDVTRVVGSIRQEDLVQNGRIPMVTLKKAVTEALARAEEMSEAERSNPNLTQEQRQANARARKQLVYDGVMSIGNLTSRMTAENTEQMTELASRHGLNTNPYSVAGWTRDMVAFDSGVLDNADPLTVAAYDIDNNRAVSVDVSENLARAAHAVVDAVINSEINNPGMTTNERVQTFADIIGGIANASGLTDEETTALQRYAGERLNINTHREGDPDGQAITTRYQAQRQANGEDNRVRFATTNTGDNTQGAGDNAQAQGNTATTGAETAEQTTQGTERNATTPAQAGGTGENEVSPTEATGPGGQVEGAGTATGDQEGQPARLSGPSTAEETGSSGGTGVETTGSGANDQRQGTIGAGDSWDSITPQQRTELESRALNLATGTAALDQGTGSVRMTREQLESLVGDMLAVYGVDYTIEFFNLASSAAWRGGTTAEQFAAELDSISTILNLKYGVRDEQQGPTDTDAQTGSADAGDGRGAEATTQPRPAAELRADQTQEIGGEVTPAAELREMVEEISESPVVSTEVTTRPQDTEEVATNNRPDNFQEPVWEIDLPSPYKIIHSNVTAQQYAQELINGLPNLTDRELEIRAAVASVEPARATDANIARRDIERQVYNLELNARREADFINNRRTESTESLDSVTDNWVDFAGQVGFLYVDNGEYRLSLPNGTDIYVSDVADGETLADLDIVPVKSSKSLSDMNSGLRNWLALDADQRPATAQTFINEFLENSQRASDERVAQHEEDARALEDLIQEEARLEEQERADAEHRAVREALDEIYKELYRLGFDEAGATEYIGAMVQHLESGRPLNNPEMLGAKAVKNRYGGNVARRQVRADEVAEMSSLELANAIYDYVAEQSMFYEGQRAGAEQALATAANLLVDMGYTPEEALAEVQTMAQDMALYLGNSPRDEESRVTARDENYDVGNYGIPPISEDVADATLGVVQNEFNLFQEELADAQQEIGAVQQDAEIPRNEIRDELRATPTEPAQQLRTERTDEGNIDEQLESEQGVGQADEQLEQTNEQDGQRQALRRDEDVQPRAERLTADETNSTANQEQQQTALTEEGVDQVADTSSEAAATSVESYAEEATAKLTPQETGKRKKLTAKKDEAPAEASMTQELDKAGVTAKEVSESIEEATQVPESDAQMDIFSENSTMKETSEAAVRDAIEKLPPAQRAFITNFANAPLHNKTRKELGIGDGKDAEQAIVEAAAADLELGFLDSEFWSKTSKGFKKAMRAVVDFIKSSAMSIAFVSMLGLAAMSPNVNLTNQAMADTGPTNVTVAEVIPSVSQDANVTRNYVKANNDANGKPYVVADKQAGAIYLFDGNHNLLEQTPALFGANVADTKVDGATPAGRFNLSYAKYDQYPSYGGSIQIFDKMPNLKDGVQEVFAVHRVINMPGQNRKGRLQSATVADNRISDGCINVPANFYDKHFEGEFDGFLYVIPETTNYTGNTFGVNPGGEPDVRYTQPVQVQRAESTQAERGTPAQDVAKAASDVTLDGKAPQGGGMPSAYPLSIAGQDTNPYNPATQIEPTTINGVTYTQVNEPDNTVAPDDASPNEYFNTKPIPSSVTDDDGNSIFDLAVGVFGTIMGGAAASAGLGRRRSRLSARDRQDTTEATATPPADGGTPPVRLPTGETPQEALQTIVTQANANDASSGGQNVPVPPEVQNAMDLERIQSEATRRGWFNYVNAISNDNQAVPMLVLSELMWGLRNAMTDTSTNYSIEEGGQQDDWKFTRMPGFKKYMRNMGGATIELDKLAKMMHSPTIGIEADASIVSASLASMKGRQIGIQSVMYRNGLEKVEHMLNRIASRRGESREQIEQDFGDYANLYHYSEEGIDHHMYKLRREGIVHRDIMLAAQQHLDVMETNGDTRSAEYNQTRAAYEKAKSAYRRAQDEYYEVLYAVDGPQEAARIQAADLAEAQQQMANESPAPDSYAEDALTHMVNRLRAAGTRISELDAMPPADRPVPDNMPGGLSREQTQAHMQELVDRYGEESLQEVANQIYAGSRFNVDYAYANGVFSAAEMNAFGNVNDGQPFQYYVPMWHGQETINELGDSDTFSDVDQFNQTLPDGFVDRDSLSDTYGEAERTFIERVGLAKDITSFSRKGSRTRPDNAVVNLRKQMNNLASRAGERAFTFQIERMFENNYSYTDDNGNRIPIQTAEDARAWYERLADQSENGATEAERREARETLAALDSEGGLQPEGRRGIIRVRPGQPVPARVTNHTPIRAKGMNSRGQYVDYRYYFVDPVVNDDVKAAIGSYSKPKNAYTSALRKTTGIMAALMTHMRPLWNVFNAFQTFVEYGGNMMFRRALGTDGRVVSNRALAMRFAMEASRASAGVADIANAVSGSNMDSHYGRLYQELKSEGTIHVFQDLVNMKAERAFNRNDPSVTRTERAKARISQTLDKNAFTSGAKNAATGAAQAYNQGFVETLQVIPVIATFEALVNSGVNRAEAHRITRDMYDPLRNAQHMGWMSTMYAFANSAKAGGYNLMRNFTQYGLKGFGATLSIITAFGLAHAIAGMFGDDDDEGVPERASEPLYTFTRGFGVTVDENGGKFYVPIGHGINKILATIAGVAYKSFHGKMDGNEAASGLATALLDNASPVQVANLSLIMEDPIAWMGLTATPTALEPFAESTLGYDSFTGRNLAPFPTPEGQNKADRQNFYTKQWAKDFAQFLRYDAPLGLDVKPETIQHLVESNAIGPLAIFKVLGNDVAQKTQGHIATNADNTPMWWTVMGGAFYDPNAAQPYRRASAIKAKAKAVQKSYPGITSTAEEKLKEQLDAAGVTGDDRKFIENTVEYEKKSRKLKDAFKEAVAEVETAEDGTAKHRRAVRAVERIGEELKQLDIKYYEENNEY